MNKKTYVIFDLFEIFLVFLGFSLCDPESLLDFLETDPDTFRDVSFFGIYFLLFLYFLFNLVCDTFSLIFRKVRKSLEKQGKE